MYTKNKKDSIQPNGLYPFTYHGTIEDSMFIEIHVPGYPIGRFTYYKSIHRRGTVHTVVYLAKEGYCPNELIFSKDWIEVSIGKEKKRYDIVKLRKSDEDDELEILCRIPGLEVTKTGIKIDGSDIEHIYLPHEHYRTSWSDEFFEFFHMFYFSLENFVIDTTKPVKANNAITLGITIMLLNISASSQTRSLERMEPRNTNTRPMIA